jgi:hypothetical protein
VELMGLSQAERHALNRFAADFGMDTRDAARLVRRVLTEFDSARNSLAAYRGLLERLTRAQTKREEEWAAQVVGKSQGRAIEAREEFDAAVADIVAFVDDASPDPGQGVAERLKAGERLAAVLHELRDKHDYQGPTRLWDALAAFDKAVGRDG